jgi:hypothetical protein
MAEPKVVTTDAEIEAAQKKAQLLAPEAVAKSVEHITSLNLLIVELSNHRRLALPLEDLQQLDRATHAELQNYELLGHGTGIHFPDLDVDLYVPSLIAGVYGNRSWMAKLGRVGGMAKTEAKRLAAKANGAKGGRPKAKSTPAAKKNSAIGNRLGSKPKPYAFRAGEIGRSVSKSS